MSFKKDCAKIAAAMQATTNDAPKAQAKGGSRGLNQAFPNNSSTVITAYPTMVLCGVVPETVMKTFGIGGTVKVERFDSADIINVEEFEGTRPKTAIEARNSSVMGGLIGGGDQTTHSIRLTTRRGDVEMFVGKPELGSIRALSLAIADMITG